MFWIYFKQGLSHITDINGYDHIAFLIALFASFTIKDYKILIKLITGFTIGHSITLALSTLNILHLNKEWIEFLIPITILITAVYHLVFQKTTRNNVLIAIAILFGLIHGAGFSNYLKSLLGKSSSITQALFAFNIGVEIGQLIILAIFFLVTYIVTDLLKLNKKYWSIGLSIIAILISLKLAIETFPL